MRLLLPCSDGEQVPQGERAHARAADHPDGAQHTERESGQTADAVGRQQSFLERLQTGELASGPRGVLGDDVLSGFVERSAQSDNRFGLGVGVEVAGAVQVFVDDVDLALCERALECGLDEFERGVQVVACAVSWALPEAVGHVDKNCGDGIGDGCGEREEVVVVLVMNLAISSTSSPPMTAASAPAHRFDRAFAIATRTRCLTHVRFQRLPQPSYGYLATGFSRSVTTCRMRVGGVRNGRAGLRQPR